MDVYGHVNNARMLTLYEEARVALMFGAARDSGITSFEAGIVIARHEIDYLRPVDYADPVRIELWVAELRPSRFVIAYELFDKDALASRARSSPTESPSARRYARGDASGAHWSWWRNSRSCIGQNRCCRAAHAATSAAVAAFLCTLDSGRLMYTKRTLPGSTYSRWSSGIVKRANSRQ